MTTAIVIAYVYLAVCFLIVVRLRYCNSPGQFRRLICQSGIQRFILLWPLYLVGVILATAYMFLMGER